MKEDITKCERNQFMKAIICVTGHDSVGIIASVSALCAKYGANIIDINQSVMEDYFTMVMMVEIDKLTIHCICLGKNRQMMREIAAAYNGQYKCIR